MPRLKEQGCLHSRNNMAAMKLFELRGFRAEWSRALWRRLRQRRQRPRLHTHWSDSSQGEDRGACVGACGSGGRGGGPPTVAALRVAERRKRAAYPEPNGGPQNNSWCLGVRRFFFLARGGEVLHLAAHGPPTACQRSGSRLGALALARSSTSPNGSASSAPGSSGMDDTPSAEQATARCRATDKTLHQRRAQPCAADARSGGGARWTRSRSRRRRNCWHSSFQRPPTSAASTTSRCGPPRVSSG